MMVDVEPPYSFPAYRATELRAPRQLTVSLVPGTTELAGVSHGHVDPADADLTAGHCGEPLGERIELVGRVVDEAGRPVVRALVEVWQANASGRYAHERDTHAAPLDPNFCGTGRCLTGEDGSYRFVTIKPGAYPWQNHRNAWRPAHIHFSVVGSSLRSRLITQMYFHGDPLLAYDPIYNSVPTTAARERLLAHLDMSATSPERALVYRWDIVLGGGPHAAAPR